MGVRVRNAGAGDFPAVRGVARTAWEHTYRDIVPAEERARFVEEAYSHDSLTRRTALGVLLVAESGGKVVGFSNFAPVADEPGDVELAAIYVLPGAQGRGVGTRLLEDGIERFAGASRVVLYVVRDNLAARRFYEGHGFRAAGEHVWRLPDRGIPELEMVKEIGATTKGDAKA